jgi:hypothetical protein
MRDWKSVLGVARAAALLAVFLSLAPLVRAQTATINGTVMDSTGAVVPQAKVTVVNKGTNASREGTTSDTGFYSFPTLAPGVYDVTVEKAGLKSVAFVGVTLTVDQALTLDAKLDVSAISQTVTVEGTNIVPINTTDAQISNVIDSKQIQELPLILRDPYQLVLLTPGSTQTNTGAGGFSINGAREQQNNFLLDGTNNNDPGVPGGGLVTLNPDATEEFRVITNNYLPEFGRNSGSIIDIVTRSGTNSLHGDVYYFGRWNALGARDFFNGATTGPQNPYVRNTFGGSVGGPVIKNKVFYFFNYEGNRFATATSTDATVPDPAFDTGIFTYVDPLAGAVPINVSMPSSVNNAYGLVLDPQIQKVLHFYPMPNGPAVIQGISDQYFFGESDLANNNNYTAKVDININSRNTLSVRYIANQGTDNGASGNPLPGIGGEASKFLTQSPNFHLSTTIKATLLNDMYFGANRTYLQGTCNGAATINSLSLAGVDPFGNGRDWALSDFSAVACPGDTDKQIDPFGTYNLGDYVTWIKGRHTMKFGIEFADNYDNGQNSFSERPLPSFAVYSNTNNVSALQNTVPFTNPTVQDSVWGLLGGTLQESQTQFFNNAGTRVPSDERGFRERDIYGYFQDQFKWKPNFTVNYGVRYEWDGVPWVVGDQLSSASQAALAGPAPIDFLTVTRGGANPLYPNDTKAFEPRIGFAWDPFKDGKTSVRAGFGYFRDRNFFNITGDTRSNPPLELPYVNSTFANLGPGAADQISNVPLPTTQVTSPFLADYPANNSLGFPLTISQNFHVAYVQQRSLGVQRELGGHFTVEVNYVGNKGDRLLRVIDGNPPIPALVAELRTYCQNPANAFGCVDSPTATTVQGYYLYIGQQLGALPFNAVNNSAAFHANTVASVANSNYNGLQTTVSRQFTNGVGFQVNYTWAHAIDDASDPFRPQIGEFVFPASSYDLKAEKGSSSFDVRNRLVFNFAAELPYGRGKNHLNSGILGWALEGWSWAGIGTFQDGFPYDVFAPGDDSNGTGALQRADYDPNGTKVPITYPLTQTGPNPGLFSFPFYGGPGNLGRNHFVGPAYKNFDMVIAKKTKINERLMVEFRSEYYNVFNHPNFQPPDNFISDASFGQSTAEVGRNDGTTGARQLQFGMKLHF